MISIGEYDIKSPHFNYMARYVADGGFMGWGDEIIPDYVDETCESLKKTKHWLFNPKLIEP